MKLRLLSLGLISLILAFSGSWAMSQAQEAPKNEFYCNVYRNKPATFAKMLRGTFPIIRWGTYDDSPPPTAQTRCEEVSRRFQVFYDNGQLKYLTTGLMNQKAVICVTDRVDGDCNGLLFTLNSGSDPKRTLLKLLDRRALARGEVVNETGDKRIYVNVSDYLNNVPLD
ncbi:hypothetical protein BCD67_03230 [Oscillatoriales cyanobacterium USR001]|nr:hypothetical protein BCD67_03230 [Oscillatoriales cyanobacterium USR001]